MATSIMVDERTLQTLKELKSKYQAKSYDETLTYLITKTTDIPKSNFGTHPRMKSFTRKDRSSFHDL
ncbi:MAG: hypothetical protein ABH950_06840 [Candidatus Altiarchaeota archaeon]